MIIRWWKFDFLSIFLAFYLFIHFLVAIAGALGYKEVWDIEVVEFSRKGTILWWSLGGLGLLHLLFNRVVSLKITENENVYRIGFIPGVIKRFKSSNIKNIDIKTRTSLAESPTGTEDMDYFILRIYLKGRRRPVRIRGLSKEDALRVKEQLERVM